MSSHHHGASMRAAVLREATGSMGVEQLRIDEPLAHEVLVRTAFAGLCHSDLNLIDGVFPTELPIVMGHEAAGVVSAVGADVTYVQPGDHVITCLSSFCGECRTCLRGRPNLCRSRLALRARSRPALHDESGQPVAAVVSLGAFAEQMVVHERALVKIRPDMPLDVAALIGCGVTTGMGAALRTTTIEPGSSAAVLGCGGIGLAAVQGARIAGAHPIIAVDISEEKLDRARRVGATQVVDARGVDVVAAVLALTDGGVDHSFEAIGTKETAEQAFAMLAPAGTATLIGMVPPVDLHIPAMDLYLHEKRIQGSNMGTNRFRLDMPWYCDLYLEGRLLLDEMVTARRPLEEINEGYVDMREGRGLRTVIDFGVDA